MTWKYGNGSRVLFSLSSSESGYGIPLTSRLHVFIREMGGGLNADLTLTNTAHELVIIVTWLVSCACRYDQHFPQSMDQPGMVTKTARGQLKRKNVCLFFPVPVLAS